MPRSSAAVVATMLLLGSAASSGVGSSGTLLLQARPDGPQVAGGADGRSLAAAFPSARCTYHQGALRIELDEVTGIFAIGHPRDAPLPPSPFELLSTPAAEIALSEAVPGVWRGTWQGDRRAILDPAEPADDAHEPGVEELRQAIRDQRPEIQWVHAALRSRASGRLLLPTPRLIVKLRSDAPEEVANRFPGARTLRPLRLARRQLLLELTDLSEHPCDAADRLRALPWVEWVEPDFVQEIEFLSTPNDPLFGDQWHLENTGQGGGTPGADARLPGAWDREVGDDAVVIAVVDTGVELAHPDLAGRIFTNTAEPIDGADNDGNGYVDDRFGWDFFDGDNDVEPLLTGTDSHGTAVAGLAAATGNNALGVTGACQSCRILPVRIGASTGFATASVLAEAVLYAGSFARIVNNSWRTAPATVLSDAIDLVATQGSGGLGTPVVCGTGNSASGYGWWWYQPAAAGTYTFEWVFEKNGSVSAGFDRAWLDSVLFPDGSVEAFDDCSALPAGWTSTGALPWSALADESRAGSYFEEGCALVSGAIGHGELSAVRVTRTLATVGKVWYQVWVSAEKNAPGGVGAMVYDDRQGSPECFDFTYLNVYDSSQTLIFQGSFHCGTDSWNGPLEEGVLAYPATLADAIAVGASTDGDRRAHYSQWGPELDLVAPSGGGASGLTTTDLAGANGYVPEDYVTGAEGTSFAAPLVSGILGLLLTDQPGLELGEIRERLRWATRKIGTEPYVGGRNDHYGWGVLSAELLLTQLLIDDFETGGLTLWSNH